MCLEVCPPNLFESMGQVFTIAVLMVRSAVRSRFLLVFFLSLVSVVGLLPFVIEHDGTAKMFTQVMMTYTLSVLTALLCGATVWLACGAISREVSECQLQVLMTKPVTRLQVWLGKWTGLAMINGTLLGSLGAGIYGMLIWHSGSLSPEQQHVLRSEILVARGVVREPVTDRTAAIERELQTRMKSEGSQKLDPVALRKAIAEAIRHREELVPPNRMRTWKIPLGSLAETVRDKPLHLRVKFQSADPNADQGEYKLHWVIGNKERGFWQSHRSMATGVYQEIEIPPNYFDSKGEMYIEARNYNNMTLRFSLDDGLIVLYPESGFGVNYFKGLAVIYSWLLAIGALGLAASGFLSFAVATFLTITLLIVFMSGGLLSEIIREGTVGAVNHETGESSTRVFDPVIVPVFQILGGVVSMARGVAPINSLSSGEHITWTAFLTTFIRMVFFLGGSVAAVGIYVFSKRELALVTGDD